MPLKYKVGDLVWTSSPTQWEEADWSGSGHDLDLHPPRQMMVQEIFEIYSYRLKRPQDIKNDWTESHDVMAGNHEVFPDEESCLRYYKNVTKSRARTHIQHAMYLLEWNQEAVKNLKELMEKL